MFTLLVRGPEYLPRFGETVRSVAGDVNAWFAMLGFASARELLCSSADTSIGSMRLGKVPTQPCSRKQDEDSSAELSVHDFDCWDNFSSPSSAAPPNKKEGHTARPSIRGTVCGFCMM